MARWVPPLQFTLDQALGIDGADEALRSTRRTAIEVLSRRLTAGGEVSAATSRELANGLPDVDFCSRYRAPFQFAAIARELPMGTALVEARGREVRDADGRWFYDVAGSYGVNVFGNRFYHHCIERGAARVSELGPVLGFHHPQMQDVIDRLRRLTGCEQFSFHMSGTEAVMQAVRLARYHTGKRHLVRFCGAYHGWWGDVQPGVGNPQTARDTYTLRDMDERSLGVLATRDDIACVLVNPLQALHPNKAAPSDSALLDSSRVAGVDRDAYVRWLKRLREVCTARGIVLIFDEVFVGFRLAKGGAQDYFGVRADLVTYGKTLGGGLPVGVVAGPPALMRRYRTDAPADICFARGTFNSHPYVIGAMLTFLEYLDTEEAGRIYAEQDSLWQERVGELNRRLSEAGLPLRIGHLQSIWTLCYTRPSRFNWLLQYYLRAEGLLLSWVGTGRLIFSLDYTDAEFDDVADRIVAAARAMERDGWWVAVPGQTDRAIRRRVLRELLYARWPWLIGSMSSPRSR
ncbi:MAG: aminotransferase class III-fold pyridoxal phosphate-dependent enzyme [Steroidobacteraceae bacterium]